MTSLARQGELNFIKRVETMINRMHKDGAHINHVDLEYGGILCSITYHDSFEIVLKHNASGLVMNLKLYDIDWKNRVWIWSGDDMEDVPLKDAITAALGVSKIYLGCKLRGSNKNGECE